MIPNDSTPSPERVINHLAGLDSPDTSNGQKDEQTEALLKHSHGLTIDREAAWKNIADHIDFSASDNKTARPYFYYKIAAAILLLIVASISIYTFTNEATGTTDYITTDTQRILTLADGSEITLNKNSRLSVSESFNEHDRNVTLEGEALFSVSKHPDNLKFQVGTSTGQVTVLGTEFNIETKGATKVYVK
ncbi:MAG: FecR domain-containing protein, partial [Cyclobacteriaceae bacterium]